jgi:hypothetical protein
MLAVAAFALMAPVAMAQAQLKFGIGAGASLPNGEFSDAAKTGYHLMATAGIQPPLAPLGFRVDGMFQEFDSKVTTSDVKLRIMSVTANAIFSMPGAVVLSPYAIGGIGMYNSKSTAAGAEANGDFGFNVGAGIKFGLAGFSAFGEARWHVVKSDDAAGPGNDSFRFIPITFGIMF